MTSHPLAGKRVSRQRLVDVGALRRSSFGHQPDVTDRAQRVSFATSGRRGSSLGGAFNQAHVIAITQAICDHRRSESITGPLFIGKDRHALSEPAFETALEVLAANHVEAMVDCVDGCTPTPVVSRSILRYNVARSSRDMQRIRSSGLQIGVDPLGGASRGDLAADRRPLPPRPQGCEGQRRSDVPVHVARQGRTGPSGLFLTLRDGQADWTQPRFDVALGNDPDADRHGIVTRSARLMKPNDILGPSSTEAVYKLYAESFRGRDHLRRIQEESQAIVSGALAGVIR